MGEQRLQRMKKPASGGRFGEFPDLVIKAGSAWRCCQTNAKWSLFFKEYTGLDGQKLAPFEEGGVSVLFEATS